MGAGEKLSASDASKQSFCDLILIITVRAGHRTNLCETRTQFNGVVILIIKNINSVFYCRFVPCFGVVFLFSFAQTFSKKHNTKITIKFENVIRYLCAYILWDD